MARRSGDDWFIGCMTNSEPRKLKLNLDFLKAGTWQMDIWADGPRAKEVPEQVRHAQQKIDWTDKLAVDFSVKGAGGRANGCHRTGVPPSLVTRISVTGPV